MATNLNNESIEQGLKFSFIILEHVKEKLDKKYGSGYADNNPQLVAALIMATVNYSFSWDFENVVERLDDIKEAIEQKG